MSRHPPKAPLVLRVGVTGHGPDPFSHRAAPDETQIRATVRDILRQIDDATQGVAQAHGDLFNLEPDPGRPGRLYRLRIISPLAEGPDQWVADEGLKLGYELQCPLPFPREEYEKDFHDPEARREFGRLLDQATAALELDGPIQGGPGGEAVHPPAAYEAVGRAVLNQTDLLIAVWDGQPARGLGGTAGVVTEALQRGIPVVWVSWADPGTWVLRLPEWRLIQTPADLQGDRDRLREQVQRLLLPPAPEAQRGSGGPTTRREEYFREAQKRGNLLHGCWPVFVGFVTGSVFAWKNLRRLLLLMPFRVPEFHRVTAANWCQECRGTILDANDPPAFAPRFGRWIESSFLDHYAWASQLSIYYANQYRGAFVLSYTLAAAAGLFALMPQAAGAMRPPWIFMALELVTILSILFLILRGRHRRWHERWIDYRTLAERLRLARCLVLLGGGGPQAAQAGHLANYGNPASTWMHWHYLALERAAGLPHVRLTTRYLAECKSFWLVNLIQDQIRYHAGNRERCEKIEARLHLAVWVLFAATLAACVAHFRLHEATGLLTLLTAFLPALGAALAGIRGQAEVQRLSRRSHAMQKSLERLKEDLASVPAREEEGNSQRLRIGLDRVADLMVGEMLDWRIVLSDRPLEVHV